MSHKIADKSNRQIRERMFCRQIGQIEKWIVAGTKKVIDVSIMIELTFNNLHRKENIKARFPFEGVLMVVVLFFTIFVL